MDKLLPKIAEKYILGIVLKQLHAPPAEEKIHFLAVQLLQRALVYCTQGDDSAMGFMAQSLLELLDEARDATSKVVVGFLAEYAARYLT